MSPELRRRALYAAARLALPFGLSGCGATISHRDSDAAADVTPDAATPFEEASSRVPDVTPRACSEPDPARTAAAEAACCEPMVDALLASDAGVSSPRAMQCCQALAAWYDRPENAGAAWPFSPARGVCCRALNWRGSTTCTPWGPPVPPGDGLHAAPRPTDAWLDLRDLARAEAPALPPLPHLYASAQATWLGRMVNEYESSAVFEALAAQLDVAGVARRTVHECRAFADEERRHGVLCGAVVEALGGEARAPAREHPDFPAHDDVGALEAALRNVLSVCCLSETVAVALIGAERLEMPDGALRELLTRILADEVGHARFGWRLVRDAAPALDEGARARLGAYLTRAFEHLERHELAHLPATATPPPEAAALGLCHGGDARVLFYETVTEVIVPALEALSLPAREAWERRGQA